MLAPVILSKLWTTSISYLVSEFLCSFLSLVCSIQYRDIMDRVVTSPDWTDNCWMEGRNHLRAQNYAKRHNNTLAEIVTNNLH